MLVFSDSELQRHVNRAVPASFWESSPVQQYTMDEVRSCPPPSSLLL